MAFEGAVGARRASSCIWPLSLPALSCKVCLEGWGQVALEGEGAVGALEWWGAFSLSLPLPSTPRRHLCREGMEESVEGGMLM